MDSVQVGQLVTLDLWIRSPTSFGGDDPCVARATLTNSTRLTSPSVLLQCVPPT